MKPSKLFKALWCSDQHTLHPKTPTSHILNNLSRFFYKENDLKEIALVVFGGDFYDRLVDAAHSDMRKTQHWIREFLLACKEHDVIVRVLEGTTSHEREQTENFVVQCPEGLDLRWVKEISLERIERLGINVIYTPDNLGGTTPDQVWEKVLSLLSENNLKKVDYAFNHFAFEFQLPLRYSKHSHSQDRWQSIVKYNIFVGHVHKPCEYGIIRGSGSFDRIQFGEDHPKGGYRFWCNPETGEHGTEFWENKYALPYVRVLQHPEDDTDKLHSRVKRMITDRKLIIGSRIQIRGKKQELINGVIESLRSDYPNFYFEVDSEKDKELNEDEDLVNDLTYEGTALDQTTLPTHWVPYMLGKGHSELFVNEHLKLLEEFL